MPLPEPALDTRTYRELAAEALRRVPVHNPEWNNFNDADPGVTLLQLFAFMAESVIYRANLSPERNRQKFLRLLGIGLEPARPARGLVAFALGPGGKPTPVGQDDEVLAGQVPFHPEHGLLALPVESRPYYKKRVEEPRRSEMEAAYNQLYASIREPLQSLDFYETQPLPAPVPGGLLPALDLSQTVDRSLWIALLALRPDAQAVRETREAIAGKVLTLGVVPALGADGKALYPAGAPAANGRPRLVFEVPDAGSSTPGYAQLDVASADDVLSAPGVVELRLPAAAGALATWETLGPLEDGVGGYPPALENSEDLDRLVTWIRLRAPAPEGTQVGGGQARVVVSWVGANAARVIQRTRVAAERLADGTGEPDQTVRVANTPVIDDSLALTVNGEPWTPVADLSEAGPEVPPNAPLYAAAAAGAPPADARVFTLDRESGEIRFGDGARGMRPPRGALIVGSYDYGGGRRGLVGIGSIARGPQRLPGVKVSNPAPTWGAADAETVAQAEKRIPATVRHRNVLATREDYEKITRATPGVDMGRVEVMPLFHPDLPTQSAEGVVTVMVIPRTDALQPEAPVPDRLFLETVCAYLAPRRILTTELHVRGPQYRPLAIGIGIQAVPGEAEGPLIESVRGALLGFLSPLSGGFGGDGWPLDKAVEPAEVQAAATRVRGVAKVTGMVLADLDGNELPPTGLAISGLELPRVAAVRVALGAPPTLADLFGGPPPADEPPALPVPVAPKEC
jgi:predicted phage baseplate assembly protein